MSEVYEWLTDANDDTHRELLTDHGESMWERGLRMSQRLPEKQRAGVYGSALSFVSVSIEAVRISTGVRCSARSPRTACRI